jgi:hypothetical protein
MTDLERRLERAGRVLDEASRQRGGDMVATPLARPPRKPWLLAAAAAVGLTILGGAVVIRSRSRAPVGIDNPTTIETVAESTSTGSTQTTGAPVTTTLPAPGTLPPTVAPSATTSPSKLSSPASSSSSSSSSSTASVALGTAGYVATPVSPAPAAGGDSTRYETWPVVGRFDGAPDVEVVATFDAQFSTPCVGVRVTSAPEVPHDWCSHGESRGFAVVTLDDRLAVIAMQASEVPLVVVTTAGQVSAMTWRAPTSGREPFVRAAAIVVPAGVDLLTVNGEQFSNCSYREILGAYNPAVALRIGACTPNAAVASSLSSSIAPQGDSVYFDRKSGGPWTYITNGGNPCMDADPASIDLSNRTAEERARLVATLARLKAACVELGEIKN